MGGRESGREKGRDEGLSLGRRKAGEEGEGWGGHVGPGASHVNLLRHVTSRNVK